MLGNKNSFYSALFVEEYNSIIAYTYNGALYLWRNVDGVYKSEPIIHGHFGAVSDLDWDLSKNLLFTNSEDQTSRAFGYWRKNGNF
jgi:elongator complex protein 2